MTGEGPKSARDMPRQDLLDELYSARDIAGEREQRILQLQREVAQKDKLLAETGAALHEMSTTLAESRKASAEIRATLIETRVTSSKMRTEMERMLASRSWRLTAPLRACARWLFGKSSRGEDAADIATLSHIPQASEPAPANAELSTPTTAGAIELVEPQDVRDNDERCLFVDVTELALKAGQTGIQRVVTEILCALLIDSPVGYRVEAVSAISGQPYRYARSFLRGLQLGVAIEGLDSLVCMRNGDIFLGLDHSMTTAVEQAATLEAIQQQGVRLWFVYHDSLPLSHPEWFPPEVCTVFRQWLEAIAGMADGIVCVSRASENELEHWLSQLQLTRQHPLQLGHFHLGADIPVSKVVSEGSVPEDVVVPEQLGTMPSFLMVGTLEPRKGHAQALEAFNRLWADGKNVALVLVGHPGWMTEVVQRRIRHHDEFGKRLFWFMSADDAMLSKLYSTCTALLFPSEGEGFGLPLIEAANYSLPILCRDLPVLREVAGDHASYFSGTDPGTLADAISTWLESYRQGAVPSTVGMPCLTWAESARQLLEVIL